MTVKKPAKASRITRTREETQEEFEHIKKEEDNKIPLPTMEAKAREAYEEKIKTDTKDTTVETVKQKLASAATSMRLALMGIEEQLQKATEDLIETRAALKLEEATLESLYGKEIIASTTKTLLEEHAQYMTKLAAERDEALAIYKGEVVKDASAGYNDAKKAQRAKIAYSLHRLEEMGKI